MASHCQRFPQAAQLYQRRLKEQHHLAWRTWRSKMRRSSVRTTRFEHVWLTVSWCSRPAVAEMLITSLLSQQHFEVKHPPHQPRTVFIPTSPTSLLRQGRELPFGVLAVSGGPQPLSVHACHGPACRASRAEGPVADSPRGVHPYEAGLQCACRVPYRAVGPRP